MKIIILAAGLGSRLRQGESELPKPLTPLKNGKSILKQQIDNISKFFCVHNITAVVGYKMSLIMEAFPQLGYVYNPDFSSTNTSKSLLKAVNRVKKSSVMWLNGDVVFHENLFDKLKPLIESDESFMAVNNAQVSEEEVKYTVDSDGYINKIGKHVSDGIGEAIGINFIAFKDLEAFKGALDECDDQDYFEKALEMMINSGSLKLKPVDISEYYCVEVDFKEDLENANSYL